jgi:hypothetical protein
MSMRARNWVVAAASLLLGGALGVVSRGWSDAQFLAAGAGLVAAVVLLGMPWIEFARDGGLRRRPGDPPAAD